MKSNDMLTTLWWILSHFHVFFVFSGIYFASKLSQNPNGLNIIEDEWETLSNIILRNKKADDVDEHDVSIMKKIKAFYYGESASISTGSWSTLIELFGDAIVFGPNEYFSSLVLDQSAQPLFFYSFDYHGSWRYGDIITLPPMKILTQTFLSCFGVKVKVPAFKIEYWVLPT